MEAIYEWLAIILPVAGALVLVFSGFISKPAKEGMAK